MRTTTLLFFLLAFPLLVKAQDHPATMQIRKKEITVNERPYEMLHVVFPNEKMALFLNKGDWFNFIVENQLQVPTCLHWHGLLLPNDQDGVPYVTQLPIEPGKSYPYYFQLVQAGTYFMHSHQGLQEQRLLSAPLILLDPEHPIKEDLDVILMLEDFSFKRPELILEELKHPPKMNMMHEMKDMGGPDVKYDAFLANRHTLSDPEIVKVAPGESVRLRIINASSATNYFISLGQLEGEALAVDGNDIVPFKSKQFELADAQRIDVRITIPLGEGAYPILAQGEQTAMQTGLILATNRATIPKLSESAKEIAGRLTNAQEKQLKAANPLSPKPIDRKLTAVLDGSMSPYVWTINGKAWPDHTPLMVKEGERVEITFINKTKMSHPMHLHGHIFQVTELNGEPINGAMRDTVLVLAHGSAKIQFDALHPGIWAFHCHLLYHRVTGMFTTVNYEGYPVPPFVPK